VWDNSDISEKEMEAAAASVSATGPSGMSTFASPSTMGADIAR